LQEEREMDGMVVVNTFRSNPEELFDAEQQSLDE
jgi:hypothetical protein